MESWLIKKKLNEAYNITQLRDTKKQQDIEMEAKNQLNQGKKIKNYKMWLT
jgi:formiminotetrahydrofolate cyclodeaminase